MIKTLFFLNKSWFKPRLDDDVFPCNYNNDICLLEYKNLHKVEYINNITSYALHWGNNSYRRARIYNITCNL